MKNFNINTKNSKKDINKAFKASFRSAMIEAGVYNIHKNRTFKSKKAYDRKDKSYLAE